MWPYDRIGVIALAALLLCACGGPALPPPDARYALGGCPPALVSYVALGSSSTAGTGASDPGRSGYVALLRDRLRATCPELRALNLGRGAARIDTLLAQAAEVERAAPSIVTILPLTDYSDTPAHEFSSGYAQLFDQLRPTGATIFIGDLRVDRAMVCDARPAGRPCYALAERQRLEARNRELAAIVATRPWVVVVPVYEQLVEHPEWQAGDGVHLNDQGHRYLAECFWAALRGWVLRQAR